MLDDFTFEQDEEMSPEDRAKIIAYLINCDMEHLWNDLTKANEYLTFMSALLAYWHRTTGDEEQCRDEWYHAYGY